MIQGKGSIAIFFLNKEVVGEVLNPQESPSAKEGQFKKCQEVIRIISRELWN